MGAPREERVIQSAVPRSSGEIFDEEELQEEPETYFKSFVPPKGSISGSVFNLAGATLGAGALALPYALAVSGVAFAFAQLTLAAFLTVYTIRLLLRASEITDLKSYEELARYCFGRKMEVFVGTSIIVFAFGVAVAYLVALGDLFEPLGDSLFGEGSFLAQRWVLMTVPCLGIMLPLSLLRDVSSLQFSSILGVFAIFFLVLAVSIRSLNMVANDGVAKDISWIINLNDGPNFMLSVPIVMFAFTNQINVFAIYSELQRPTRARMSRVVNSATGIAMTVYAVIGICAYLAFGASLTDEGNILKSFSDSDTLIACSRAGIAFTVCVAFPLNIFPCRFSIDSLFFGVDKSPLWRHASVTCGLVFSALLLAIFCPNINVVFGIIGGTCSAIVCFCFPAAYALRLESGPLLGRNKIGPFLLFIGAVVIGIAGTSITIWSNFFS